jgi:gluconolactonase
MRRLLALAALTAICTSAAAAADGLESILAPGAKLEHVATGLKFAEGPVWDGRRLLVSDVQGDTLYELIEGGKFRPLQAPTRWANGHSWDRTGALLAAEHASGEVTRRTAGGKVETLAARYGGKRLNSPNDVVVRSDGLVYFTDPPFGLKPPYGPVERKAELGFAGVYRVDPKTKSVTLLTKDLQYPNGIAFSPDETRLYLNDTGTQKVWVYDVTPDGGITNGREFADLKVEGAKGVVDGMKVDAAGHLYSVCPAGVCVLSSNGKLLGTISVPEQATDVAWGGPDRNVLYVTASTSLYRIQTRMKGVGSGIR